MSPLNRFAFCAALLSVALLAGCKKQSPVPSADSGPQSNQEASVSAAPPSPAGPVPMPPPPPPAVVPENADVNVTLSQLSLELRKFVVRTRTVPKSFEEFVAKSRVQVPPPPSGKKYVIEGQAVVLKNL